MFYKRLRNIKPMLLLGLTVPIRICFTKETGLKPNDVLSAMDFSGPKRKKKGEKIREKFPTEGKHKPYPT